MHGYSQKVRRLTTFLTGAVPFEHGHVSIRPGDFDSLHSIFRARDSEGHHADDAPEVISCFVTAQVVQVRVGVADAQIGNVLRQ